MYRRRFLAGVAAGLATCTLTGCQSPSLVEKKATTQGNSLYIDGLSFVPDSHLDVKASGLNAFIADVSDIEAITMPDGSTNYKRTYDACIKSINKQLQQMQASADTYLVATRGTDIQRALNQQRCAVFLQIQGADCVEGGWQQLDEFYALGLRVLQLTHHYNNKFAGGALSTEQIGLTTDGVELIRRLEQQQMLIDLSHSSVMAAEQTLALAKGPVIQSHGAARAIINNARCTPDHVIKAIADSGGVFGVFMMSWWLTYDKVPRPEHYIQHIKHIKNIAGVEGVAIANDYPVRGHLKALESGNNNQVAIEGYDSWWQSLGRKGILGFEREVEHIVIPELNHIKRMRSIHYLLEKAGFTPREQELIMGKNWQRVLVDVLG